MVVRDHRVNLAIKAEYVNRFISRVLIKKIAERVRHPIVVEKRENRLTV